MRKNSTPLRPIFFDVEVTPTHAFVGVMWDHTTRYVPLADFFKSVQSMDADLRTKNQHTTLVGWNSMRYDLPMLAYAHAGRYGDTPQTLNDTLFKSFKKSGYAPIKHEWKQIIEGLGLTNIDFFDLTDVRKYNNVSLKYAGGKWLGRFYNDQLTDDLDELKRYNLIDLEVTRGLYELGGVADHQRQTLEMLREEFNVHTVLLDTQNITNIISKSFEVNMEYTLDKHLQTLLRSPSEFAPKVKARYEAYMAGDEHMGVSTHPVGGCVVEPVLGGLHSARQNIHIVASEDMYITNIDLASAYPNTYKEIPIYAPAEMSMLATIIAKRVEMKTTDPLRADAYKLLLNSLYGKMEFQPTKPNNMVTSSCQVILMECVERAVAQLGKSMAVEVLHVNTDGFIIATSAPIDISMLEQLKLGDSSVLTPDATEYLHYTEVTQSYFTLEVDTLSELWLADVNNLVARFANGKIKRVGRYKLNKKMTNTANLLHWDTVLSAVLEDKTDTLGVECLHTMYKKKHGKKGAENVSYHYGLYNPTRLKKNIILNKSTPFSVKVVPTWEAWVEMFGCTTEPTGDYLQALIVRMCTDVESGFRGDFHDYADMDALRDSQTTGEAFFYIGTGVGGKGNQNKTNLTMDVARDMLAKLDAQDYSLKIGLNWINKAVIDIDIKPYDESMGISRGQYNTTRINIRKALVETLKSASKCYISNSKNSGVHIYTDIENIVLPLADLEKTARGVLHADKILKGVEGFYAYSPELIQTIPVLHGYKTSDVTVGTQSKTTNHGISFIDFLTGGEHDSTRDAYSDTALGTPTKLSSLPKTVVQLITSRGYNFGGNTRCDCPTGHTSSPDCVSLVTGDDGVFLHCHACTDEERYQSGVKKLNDKIKEQMKVNVNTDIKTRHTETQWFKNPTKRFPDGGVFLDARPTGSGKTWKLIQNIIDSLDPADANFERRYIVMVTSKSALVDMRRGLIDRGYPADAIATIYSDTDIASESFIDIIEGRIEGMGVVLMMDTYIKRQSNDGTRYLLKSAQEKQQNMNFDLIDGLKRASQTAILYIDEGDKVLEASTYTQAGISCISREHGTAITMEVYHQLTHTEQLGYDVKAQWTDAYTPLASGMYVRDPDERPHYTRTEVHHRSSRMLRITRDVLDNPRLNKMEGYPVEFDEMVIRTTTEMAMKNKDDENAEAQYKIIDIIYTYQTVGLLDIIRDAVDCTLASATLSSTILREYGFTVGDSDEPTMERTIANIRKYYSRVLAFKKGSATAPTIVELADLLPLGDQMMVVKGSKKTTFDILKNKLKHRFQVLDTDKQISLMQSDGAQKIIIPNMMNPQLRGSNIFAEIKWMHLATGMYSVMEGMKDFNTAYRWTSSKQSIDAMFRAISWQVIGRGTREGSRQDKVLSIDYTGGNIALVDELIELGCEVEMYESMHAYLKTLGANRMSSRYKRLHADDTNLTGLNLYRYVEELDGIIRTLEYNHHLTRAELKAYGARLSRIRNDEPSLRRLEKFAKKVEYKLITVLHLMGEASMQHHATQSMVGAEDELRAIKGLQKKMKKLWDTLDI